jgi:hypothetical protein
MSIQHFKELYDIAKNDGIKSALEHDIMATMKRHPTLTCYITSAILASSTPKPQEEVDIDVLLIDDKDTGHQLRMTGRVPLSIAQSYGWVSESNDKPPKKSMKYQIENI